MEILKAFTAEEIKKVRNMGHKIMRKGIKNGDPKYWNISEAYYLGNTELRLALVQDKTGEETTELNEALEAYRLDPSPGNKRKLLIEMADQRELHLLILKEIGSDEGDLIEEQTEKRDRIGEFDWDYLTSVPREAKNE